MHDTLHFSIATTLDGHQTQHTSAKMVLFFLCMKAETENVGYVAAVGYFAVLLLGSQQ